MSTCQGSLSPTILHKHLSLAAIHFTQTHHTHSTLHRDIESSIEVAKQQISEAKGELQQAQIIRCHRQEYNALAKVRVGGCLSCIG